MLYNKAQGSIELKWLKFFSQVMAILKKWKVVALFLDELPGTATRRLFADCQLYIWSVEGRTSYVLILILKQLGHFLQNVT